MATTRPLVGWREWIGFPDLGIERVKAKIDTGARTSSLHAFDIETSEEKGVCTVCFRVHPLQKNNRVTVTCEARLLELRWIRSSNGKRQLRPVVETQVQLGEQTWPIEVTLTRRDLMGFRMLLGRQALRGHFWVDPGRSYVASQHPRSRNPV